jgi:hypothetical protein
MDPNIGNLTKAFLKVFERAMDPDSSPDPVVRNLQDSIDKLHAQPDEPDKPDDLADHSMDLEYGGIYRESLKCLPDKITTTSHYRYVLLTLRRDKQRLHAQIETDRDMVAAMDATLDTLRDAIRPLVDKGKGRDRG